MDTATTARFNELQRKLAPLWKLIGQPDHPGGEHLQDPNTIVVIPSMSLDREFKSSAQQAYEERLLFMLFLLRQPHIRIIGRVIRCGPLRGPRLWGDLSFCFGKLLFGHHMYVSLRNT